MKSSDHKTVASQFVTFVGLFFALVLGFFVVNQGVYTAKGGSEKVLGTSKTATASGTMLKGCAKTSPKNTSRPLVVLKTIANIHTVQVTWSANSQWGNGCPNRNGYKITISKQWGSPLYITSPFISANTRRMWVISRKFEPNEYFVNLSTTNDGGKTIGPIIAGTPFAIKEPSKYDATPTPQKLAPSPTPTRKPTPTPTRKPTPTKAAPRNVI